MVKLYDTDMNKIAEGETPYQISIPADTTVTHKIDFQTDWLGSVSGVEDLINPFKNAEWTIEGEIYVDIGPSTFTIPFTEKVKP